MGKKHISIIFNCLLGILILAYYGSNSMFYHTHMVNGKIISHSHPYKPETDSKLPVKSHKHSHTAYSLINHVNKISWENPLEVALISKPAVKITRIKIIYDSPCINFTFYTHVLLRAPPIA